MLFTVKPFFTQRNIVLSLKKYTCIESVLIISPLNFAQSSRANLDFPAPVDPNTTTNGVFFNSFDPRLDMFTWNGYFLLDQWTGSRKLYICWDKYFRHLGRQKNIRVSNNYCSLTTSYMSKYFKKLIESFLCIVSGVKSITNIFYVSSSSSPSCNIE